MIGKVYGEPCECGFKRQRGGINISNLIYILLYYSYATYLLPINYVVKILICGCFTWKGNVWTIVYVFVDAANYVDFCPRTI